MSQAEYERYLEEEHERQRWEDSVEEHERQEDEREKEEALRAEAVNPKVQADAVTQKIVAK